MSVFDLPTPAWMAEDHQMLAEQSGRFFEAEVAPRYDDFEKAGVFDRDIWEQAGAAGLLCAAVPEEFGGPGGDFAEKHGNRVESHTVERQGARPGRPAEQVNNVRSPTLEKRIEGDGLARNTDRDITPVGVLQGDRFGGRGS